MLREPGIIGSPSHFPCSSGRVLVLAKKSLIQEGGNCTSSELFGENSFLACNWLAKAEVFCKPVGADQSQIGLTAGWSLFIKGCSPRMYLVLGKMKHFLNLLVSTESVLRRSSVSCIGDCGCIFPPTVLRCQQLIYHITN